LGEAKSPELIFIMEGKMKITDVKAIVISASRSYVASAGLKTPAPKKKPPKSKALTSDYASRRHICIYPRGVQTTLVQVSTDEGITGIGESHAPIAPQVSKAIIDTVLTPVLVGQDPLEIEVLWEKMYSTMRLRGHSTGFMTEAISGVDIALWDILGKVTNLPVYKLLGGAFRDKIKAYASGIPGSTNEQRIANAKKFIHERGFTALKMSIGRGSLEGEIENIAAVSEAISDAAHLLIDAHGAYDAYTAINLGRELEKFTNIYWLEDPLLPEDDTGYKMLSDALDLAIAAGETECNRYQFRYRLSNRTIDILLPDICRAGGISECRKIAQFADSYNIPWAAHVSMGSPVHIAASLHLAAATPNFLICECPSGENPIGNNLLKEPIVCENGYFEIPTGTGLGIEFDEEGLAEVVAEESK
jgi:L-alanine-DL-glutamate epimerase-like enolase superfamily enzyme